MNNRCASRLRRPSRRRNTRPSRLFTPSCQPRFAGAFHTYTAFCLLETRKLHSDTIAPFKRSGELALLLSTTKCDSHRSSETRRNGERERRRRDGDDWMRRRQRHAKPNEESKRSAQLLTYYFSGLLVYSLFSARHLALSLFLSLSRFALARVIHSAENDAKHHAITRVSFVLRVCS